MQTMSSPIRRIAPPLIDFALSEDVRLGVRRLRELGRRLRREPHRLFYFHQVDDPYSHLVAQILPRLLDRYDVVLEPRLVGPPPAEAAPERVLLEAWARKDAADIAPGYGLEFPGMGGETTRGSGSGASRTGEVGVGNAAKIEAPKSAAVALARRLLAGAIRAGSFAQWAGPVGEALWAGDVDRLEAWTDEIPAARESETAEMLHAGNQERARRGHYLGAMLYYEGGWYWGVDRLAHLEARWQALGLGRPGHEGPSLVERPDFRGRDDEVRADPRFRLEFYASLRSPYSAIVMDRVNELPSRLPVDVIQRPVLPMVMRGLPVPSAKRFYILLDTKREAEAAGVDFGRICDPVGRPVERGFSLFPLAQRRGVAAEYLASFARAAFAEGIDTGEDEGLRIVCERAGLDWAEAEEMLDRPGWETELEANRAQMFAFGLWGVPSFRLLGDARGPDFCTWGQDRLWRIEQEIRRRVGAPTR
jgi:2-hydroxychromene-2-carboxylate isomerase